MKKSAEKEGESENFAEDDEVYLNAAVDFVELPGITASLMALYCALLC